MISLKKKRKDLYVLTYCVKWYEKKKSVLKIAPRSGISQAIEVDEYCLDKGVYYSHAH